MVFAELFLERLQRVPMTFLFFPEKKEKKKETLPNFSRRYAQSEDDKNKKVSKKKKKECAMNGHFITALILLGKTKL